jgi:hypothetical protein
VRHGLLPHFVVGYFIGLQKKKNLAMQTKFFRAMWLIHKFREFQILPPLHPLAFLDTASVQAVGRLAGDVQSQVVGCVKDAGPAMVAGGPSKDAGAAQDADPEDGGPSEASGGAPLEVGAAQDAGADPNFAGADADDASADAEDAGAGQDGGSTE